MLNIVICGTPGTGKSSLIENLKSLLPEFNIVNMGKFAIENNCIESYDSTLDTQVIDEEKLDKLLLPHLKEKKLNLIECIHPDLLPDDIVDHVFVCRTENTLLYDRLKARDYNEIKIKNNLEAEIFRTILDEALEYFSSSIVDEINNNDKKDLDKNTESIVEKVKKLLSNK